MATDHTSLTSDIQRALNDAVSEAGAFAQSHTGHSKQKRWQDETAQPAIKDKKRRKRHEDVQDNAGFQAVEPTEFLTSTKVKKKSRKKDKDKTELPNHDAEAVEFHPSFAQMDASMGHPNAQATSAFLAGMVAAAAGTSHAHAQMSSGPPFLPDAQYQPQDMIPPGPPHASQYAYSASVQYPFPGAQFGHHPHPDFPPMEIPLPDFAYGSNEDILRAIQGLDMSKLGDTVKTLTEASEPADSPSFPGALQAQQSQPLSDQAAVASGISKQSSVRAKPKRTLDMTLPGPEANEDHAHLLANKWLSTSKLATLVKTQGLVYKKGKFSAIEEVQVKSAIENFRQGRQLTNEDITEIIFAKVERARDDAFWSEITAAVPFRPIIAVYHHVRRIFHPMKQQGDWQPSQDDELKQAVADLGQSWERVSERVGRMASDCRDRYRNHIVNREVRVKGPWSTEEEEELTWIVTEMTIKQGKDMDNDVFWGKVSERMGGKRGRQQCRIKWTDALSKTIKNEGQKPRWSQRDAYILVHKVDSMNVRDDTEIDWKTLPDNEWNLWSAHSLQRRWLTMKKSVKGYEDMTHQEIMDILRVKKSQLPATSTQGKQSGHR